MSEDAWDSTAPDEDDEHPRTHAHHVWIWIAVAALVVVIAILVIVHATRHAPRRPHPAPIQVDTAVATEGDLPVQLDGIGTVTSLATAQIASQVSAQIEAVHYREGQLVKKGDLLFELDERPFRAALVQAEGTLRHDLQVLAQARMDLARYRAAWAKHAIPQQLLQDQAHVVLQTQGTVQNDRGAVQAARIQLAYCQVRSPIDGRVGLRLVDPGNLVIAAATTPLAVVTQVQPTSVVFTISEDNLEELWRQPDHGVGAPVVLFDRARTHELATGKLDTIDNQIDTTTGTVRVRAVFENRDETLFPNEFVNTRLRVETLRDVVLLPSSAVQRSAERTYVFAIEDDRVHLQPVKVTASDSVHSAVLGILPGAVVATNNFEKLREGVEVAPRAPHPMPTPETGPISRLETR